MTGQNMAKELGVQVKTAITEMFGIRHPIIQGGMHYVGLAQLASAEMMPRPPAFDTAEASCAKPT